jgi:hypothetical protein
VVVLDGLGDLIEVPLLGSCVLSPSSQPDVVGTMAFSDSLEWQSGSDVEWSVDVESKFFVQSLSFSLCLLIEIKYLPSLVGTIVSTMNLDSLHFNIFTLVHIKTPTAFLDVAEMFSLIHKDLPPPRVSAPDLHFFCLT